MRIVIVERTRHTGPVRLPDETQVNWSDIVDVMEDADIPDGTPFLIDDDGDLVHLRRVNAYLLEASRQLAFAGTGLQAHAASLRRLLLFVRETRGRVDLTAVQRPDLIAYKARRRLVLSHGSWNGELSHISGFFYYAVKAGWIRANPIPKWGEKERNTLADRVNTYRRERFLTEPQLRFFLESGLRGDYRAERADRPRYAERDYVTGLLLVSTGLRRAEARFLLDCEVPTAATMHPSGVEVFRRTGKNNVTRDIWLTDGLVDVVDLYRGIDRDALIEGAQNRLRKRRRAGELLVVEQTLDSRGRALLIVDGLRCIPERLTDLQRAHAVSILPDGRINPLALILVEGGLPPALRTVNNIFTEASKRVANLDHPDVPPAHLDVTPHVMRHTFAVRMLAALMRSGRESHNNPYHLLASPEFTVQELMGHADLKTTLIYLRAALRYNEDLPAALRGLMVTTLGRPGGQSPFTSTETETR